MSSEVAVLIMMTNVLTALVVICICYSYGRQQYKKGYDQGAKDQLNSLDKQYYFIHKRYRSLLISRGFKVND